MKRQMSKIMLCNVISCDINDSLIAEYFMTVVQHEETAGQAEALACDQTQKKHLVKMLF